MYTLNPTPLYTLTGLTLFRLHRVSWWLYPRGCGSTIGPILSTNMGVRTVDVGVPQLSMHSVREMCGTEDIDICFRHFTAFFDHFATIDAQMDDVDAMCVGNTMP